VKPTRRQVLALSTLVTAGAVVAGGGTLVSWWDQPVGAGYDHLSEDEAAFVRALAGAIYPSTATLSLGGEEAQLDHFLDQSMGLLDELPRNGMRVLMHGLQSWPRVDPKLQKGAAFANLDLAARMDLVDRWLGSDSSLLRQAVQSLVVLMGMGYTSHPAVSDHFAQWHGCGYGR
jgi:hypothetical protein